MIDVPNGVILELPVIWAQYNSSGSSAIRVVNRKVRFNLVQFLRYNIVDLTLLVEAGIPIGGKYFMPVGTLVKVSISVSKCAHPFRAADEVDTAKSEWACLKVVMRGNGTAFSVGADNVKTAARWGLCSFTCAGT